MALTIRKNGLFDKKSKFWDFYYFLFSFASTFTIRIYQSSVLKSSWFCSCTFSTKSFICASSYGWLKPKSLDILKWNFTTNKNFLKWNLTTNEKFFTHQSIDYDWNPCDLSQSQSFKLILFYFFIKMNERFNYDLHVKNKKVDRQF